jgi:hypothetical protein
MNVVDYHWQLEARREQKSMHMFGGMEMKRKPEDAGWRESTPRGIFTARVFQPVTTFQRGQKQSPPGLETEKTAKRIPRYAKQIQILRSVRLSLLPGPIAT